MGPPHECSGMDAQAAQSKAAGQLLQWGRRTNAAECSAAPSRRLRTTRFNGAAARMQRNELRAVFEARRPGELQWGRRTNAAECRVSGLAVEDSHLGFNGAAARMQRNATDRLILDALNFTASMGPPHECSGMQLSHGLHRAGHLASMGPPHECSGMREEKMVETFDQPASMGPPHECSGMGGVVLRLVRRNLLQWGRRTNAAECPTTSTGQASATSFNGAAARMQRNGCALTRACDKRREASMGPPHECSGMAGRSRSSGSPRTGLQWGRRTNAAECRGSSVAPYQNRFRFNGAAARMQRNARPRARRRPHPTRASMGPPHECSGMLLWKELGLAICQGLQWGRRTNAAE